MMKRTEFTMTVTAKSCPDSESFLSGLPERAPCRERGITARAGARAISRVREPR
jgi:hypothetical protein